jgi:hypothetical protein
LKARGTQAHLSLLGEELEGVVDVLAEAPAKHLVRLVEAEHLDVVGLERAAVDHVKDATGGANNDVGALGELLHVLADVDTTDAGVAVDRHVVAEGDDDLLDLLGELTRGGEDDSLGRLDRGVDLEKRSTEASQLERASSRRAEHERATRTRCRIEIENVAVLPVPDWAWAITSLPLTTGMMARCWMAEGRSKP